MHYFLFVLVFFNCSLFAFPRCTPLEEKSRKDVQQLRLPKFYWQMALLLHKKPEHIKAHMKTLCRTMIQSHLQQNSTPIVDIVPLIYFWASLENSPPEDTIFLQAIDTLWIKKRNLNRARQLALFLDLFSKSSRPALCATLHQCFSYSLANNDLEALIFIHPLLTTFEIMPDIPERTQLIYNQLADARYFLKRGEKEEAKLRLQWVLLLQENETKALALLHSLEKK